MALEAVALSQAAGLFGRCAMAGAGGAWINGLFGGGGGGGMMGLDDGAGDHWAAAVCASSSSMLLHGFQEEVDIPAAAAPPQQGEHAGGVLGQDAAAPVTGRRKRKRRRTRTAKNEEEVESQRVTHIAVERNRRRQMNEYLAVLRCLMPPSYAQRGDQASIVGGAINFVKEMEQLVQSLEAHKRSWQCAADASPPTTPPFANFFTFPQYSMSVTSVLAPPSAGDDADVPSGSRPSAVADVEVTMVESHANLRVLSQRRPRQLLQLLMGLQRHRLTVLHLNMTSAGDTVLYSLNLKVEDNCQLTSVDEIATAAHQIVEKIQEDHQGQLAVA